MAKSSVKEEKDFRKDSVETTFYIATEVFGLMVEKERPEAFDKGHVAVDEPSITELGMGARISVKPGGKREIEEFEKRKNTNKAKNDKEVGKD